MYKNKKGKKILVTIIMILVLLTIIIGIYKIYANIDINTYDDEVIVDKTSKEIIDDNNKDITEILEYTNSSVVGISKIKDKGNTIFLQDGATKLGLGSGVIVSEDGYILTNEHVSGEKYSKCYVTLENGTTHNANVVWSDSDLDLSIIKIPMKGLTYASLGDSKQIKVGQIVYAIGNPIGYEFQRTVTSGIISALNRTIKIEEDGKTSYMNNLIQTDAGINPGNSGGPLINSDGQIIGVNSVKITSAEGIGFAVPINCVKPIVERFIKEGKFDEAGIGIFAYDRNIISYIAPNIELQNGIYVEQISEDSPAKKTDLRVGDIITKIDGIELINMCDLREYIYTKNPGDEVSLDILRNKNNLTIKIKLSRK